MMMATCITPPARCAREYCTPIHARRRLHQDEQRDDGADGDRQACVTFEEERVAEEHQEHELRQAGARDRRSGCRRPRRRYDTTRNTLTIEEIRKAA